MGYWPWYHVRICSRKSSILAPHSNILSLSSLVPYLTPPLPQYSPHYIHQLRNKVTRYGRAAIVGRGERLRGRVDKRVCSG
jgi:hypothetical protein